MMDENDSDDQNSAISTGTQHGPGSPMVQDEYLENIENEYVESIDADLLGRVDEEDDSIDHRTTPLGAQGDQLAGETSPVLPRHPLMSSPFTPNHQPLTIQTPQSVAPPLPPAPASDPRRFVFQSGLTFDFQVLPEVRSCYQAEPPENPDDKYRPEGTLYLEIDHFSDFVRGPPETQQRLSKSIFVRGMPWKILAIPREQCRAARSQKALGFFLQCNGDSTEGVSWNCIAHATLKVLSKRDHIEDHQRRISHTFYPKENDWGYSQFLACEHLANPDHGYIEDDCVTLAVHVAADAPHGVMWDSKEHTGHIGLKNQGATCYMNSLLQTLFFTNALRKAVYEMPSSENDSDNSVALAMQRVFYDLQLSDKPVGTKKLTKSFGWDTYESFMQHDVQELCRVLLENLETKMKGTEVDGVIPKLFQGKMLSYIKCTDVDFSSELTEVFYDVQLNVRPKMDKPRGENDSTARRFSLIESFRDYVEPERLDEPYDAGTFGRQAAIKGTRFSTFPPVLHLQLMRFQFDSNLESNVKVNERFEFPDLIDLNEFVMDRGDVDYTFCLHSVLVHAGDFHGGHYVVFINTDVKSPVSRWCKFDDDVVSCCTFRDAVPANYGGDDSEVLGRMFTNAYMLVYVQRSAINEVLCSLPESSIPQHLRERFEAEKFEESRKKKEKMEAHLYMDVYFLTASTIASNHGFDLYDPKTLDELSIHQRIEKAMTVHQFFTLVGKLVVGRTREGKDELPDAKLLQEILGGEFRLWQFTENAIRDECTHAMSLMRSRASSQVLRNEETAGKRIDEILECEKTVIFVEMPTLRPDGTFKLADYNEKTDMLMFLKYFNHKRKELVYCGNKMVNYRCTLETIVADCNEKAGLPPGTKLRFYEEVAPDRIRAIESLSMPLCSEYMLCEVNDGGILIFERIDETTMNDNVKTFLEEQYSQIEVELVQNVDVTQLPMAVIRNEEPPYFGNVYLNWSAIRLTQWIGENIGCDPQRLLLWRCPPYNDRPTSFIVDSQLKAIKVKDLLSLVGEHVHDPRKLRGRYRIFYNHIPCIVSEMEKRRQMKISMIDEKFVHSDATVFPDRNGTVSSILEEAKRIFKFAPGGSGQLRLVYVGISSHCRRVYQIFGPEEPVMAVYQKILTPAMYTVRVEEIPNDQLVVGPHEYLLPVAHFDKDSTQRMFGTPFFIKVTDGEPLQSVRARLRERLDVPEKEFEKYKFALLTSAKIVRYLDMDSENRVNLAELGHTHMAPNLTSTHANAPYLGIDHPNKAKNSKGGHPSEKAIVIHN